MIISRTHVLNDCFNPRSYVRSDTQCKRQVLAAVEFQSTLLREERRYRDGIDRTMRVFQSTLLREERPDGTRPREAVTRVSIHAPT